MSGPAIGPCPVCSLEGAEYLAASESKKVACKACGEFVITSMASHMIKGEAASDIDWSNSSRAALSHLIRTRRDLALHSGTNLPLVDRTALERLAKEGLHLPTPSEQVRNLIRCIGERSRTSGPRIQPNMNEFRAVVGTVSDEELTDLAYDLKDEGYFELSPPIRRPGISMFGEVRMTLKGWRYWESLHQGSTTTVGGFIAMQFGDERLDAFISANVIGRVAQELGVSIHRVDSSGVSKAGVIDNIMREAIADAAFVLVELSHGNKGAYWEAGYAEGLGKPVIYLCEQAVWDDLNQRPHFDVNHCTTVMWSETNPDVFVEQLVATINNSLRGRK